MVTKLSCNDGRTIDVEEEKRGINVRSTRVSQQTTYIYEGDEHFCARVCSRVGGGTASGGISQASGELMARYCGRIPPYDRIRRCSSKWQETEIGRATVKCRGFKSCWRGLWWRRFRGFEREGRERKYIFSFPSSFSFPTASPTSTPRRSCPDVGKIGNESQTVGFSSGTKGNLARTRLLLTKPGRKEKSIHIVYWPIPRAPMLSSPDSSPPEEANPSPRLFDYRHTSCKHRNFLDFRTSLLLFLFAFIILSPLSSIFPAWRLIGGSYLFFQRAPTLAKNFTKLARPILRTTREAWGPASPYPRSILLE